MPAVGLRRPASPLTMPALTRPATEATAQSLTAEASENAAISAAVPSATAKARAMTDMASWRVMLRSGPMVPSPQPLKMFICAAVLSSG